jgi:ubiquinone/menaquinone biosynthesis C-methylase UbiE
MEEADSPPDGRELKYMKNQTNESIVHPSDAADAAEYAAAYDGSSRFARYFQSRLYVVGEQLRARRSGDLLDVGCGPGMMIRQLVDSRPGDFKITGLDLSAGMVNEAATRLHDTNVEMRIGRAECLPFPDASFDVVLALGVLEYTDLSLAISEISRVSRPGGLVLVTMLNPLNPYRLVEWCCYWPALRLLGRCEQLVGVPAKSRHGAPRTGIRAYTKGRLRGLISAAGLEPTDVVYYDLTPLVPPLDRVARRINRRWINDIESTITRGAGRWMGTAYLIAARRRTQGRT